MVCFMVGGGWGIQPKLPRESSRLTQAANPRVLIPLAIKKDLHFYKCRSVGGSEGIRKERSDGIAQRSGASRVVNNHFCDNSGWHTNRRKRKSSSPCVNCFLLRPKRCRQPLAEAKGFEPLYRLLGNRISSAGRYNHFDTLPYFV